MSNSDTVRCVLRQKGPEIFSVSAETSVYDAVSVMADHEVGALLVLDENSRLEGLISERDYARKVVLQGRSSRDTAVSEIMSDQLITVTPEKTVDECMKLMIENRVRHLPVTRLGEVVGVISMGDLVRYVISSQEQQIEHLQAYIYVS